MSRTRPRPRVILDRKVETAREIAQHWLRENPDVRKAAIRRHSDIGALYICDSADLGFSIDPLIEVVERASE